MVSEYADELRLLFLVVLNAIVLTGAWRFARRLSPADLPLAMADTFGIWYLVQYAAVGLPGLLGILSPISASVVALLCTGLLLWGASRLRIVVSPSIPPARLASWTFAACFLFVAGYLAALTWDQGYLPVVTHDAMAYHMPAAVQWLQTGRLGIFEPWFHTPANAYSPLAGSVFICWLLLPLHSDSVARFVQEPALLMMFCCGIPILRRLGLPILAASVAAVGIVMARPFVSQAILPKDDNFVAAFFAWAVLALCRALEDDKAAPWRLGAALGLLFATKYTALFSAPLLLLCLDLPAKAHWRLRHILIVIGGVLVLAGPWFLRNLMLSGNPLYPSEIAVGDTTLLPGLFQTQRSPDLRSVHGIYEVLFRGYYSPPKALSIVAGVLWLVGLGMRGSELLKDPIVRLTWFGPLLGMAVFIAISPYAQARFVYPAFTLWLLAASAALTGRLGWITAGAVTLASVLSAFDRADAWWFALIGLVVALGAVIVLTPKTVTRYALAAASFCLVGFGFVYWHGYVGMCEQLACDAWEYSYGPVAQVWAALREKQAAEPGAVVAHTAAPQVYALYGPRLSSPVVYVPVSPKISTMRDVPPSKAAWSEEQPPRWWVTALHAEVDDQLWLDRLRASGAKYLFIGKPRLWSLDLDKAQQLLPPELQLIGRHPAPFHLVSANDGAELYRIEWPVAAR